jgi:hypothetical protein
VAFILEAFLEAIEGIGEGGLRAFANRTITGDKFLVTEAMLFAWVFWLVVGIVYFTEFMTDAL